MVAPVRRTTLDDVARRAGVSPKTVSRVLNNEPHVKAAVRERVREAAAALSYQPNLVAQSLVTRRSYLIGLVYENPSPSYVVELQMGALERLRSERYRLVVFPVRSVQEHAGEVVGLLRAAALDGVVLAPPASDHPRVLEELRAFGIAFARIAPTRQLADGPVNLLDDVAAARTVAEHVIAMGHRDIGIIKGDPDHPSSEARLLGYGQAFHQHGVPMRLDRIERGMYTFDSGAEAARRLLSGPVRPTAILSQNDEMAVGAMTAARELGLDLPRDLSIAGFDNAEASRIVWPALTTVHQPIAEMAASAVEQVLGELEGRPVERERRHEPRLIVRRSVTPPPA
jgi:LacI family transcriptional regulator